MTNLSYSEIQRQLNQPKLNKLPKLYISILRNIMLEPIIPYLRYQILHMGFNGIVSFGEYDNIYQEAVGGQNSYRPIFPYHKK